MNGKLVRIPLLATVAFGLAGGYASAAILTVPSGAHPTIQLAVDHANANDSIVILPGEYRENVVIPINKPGLTISGQLGYGGICPTAPSVIVDGCVGGSCAGDVFFTSAARTTFRCLELRHGDTGIYADADASLLTVHQLSFTHNENYGVEVYGGGFKILYSLFAGTNESAVYSDAPDGVVNYNTIRQVDGNCIDLNDDRMTVHYNTLSFCGGDGIYVAGNLASVRFNTLEAMEAYGINVDGCNATVASNKVLSTYDGAIYVSCGTLGTPTTVLSNQVEFTVNDDAIYVGGDYALVKGNTAKNSGQGHDCFEISGNYGRFEGNTALSCGYDAFYISGYDPVVLNNKADKQSYNGYGFEIDCAGSCTSAIRIEGNNATGANSNYGYLITLQGALGANIVNNNAANNIGFGFAIYVDDSKITSNTATNNGAWRDAGIYVSGNGNSIKQNAAINNAHEGIAISGCQNVLYSNQARYNLEDGFQIELGPCAWGYGNILERNLAQFNKGEGFEIYDSETVLNYNTGYNNRRVRNGRSGDCTNDSGVALTLLGNTCGDGSDFQVPSEAE